MAKRRRKTPTLAQVRKGLTLPSMDEFIGPMSPSPWGSSLGGLFSDEGRQAAGRPRSPISARASRLRGVRKGIVRQIVDDFGNLVEKVPVVGRPVADLIRGAGDAAEKVTGTVLGAPGRPAPSRRGRGRLKFDLLKGRKFGKTSKRKLMRLGAPNVSRGARGIIKINPVSGGAVGLVVGALGAGAGYVVATKTLPGFVGRFVPVAAQGLLGAAVGALGGMLVGRVVGKYNAKIGSGISMGSMVALGVALLGQVVKLLPSSITAPIGLSGMRDYLQLSGPVPADLFAGGMNDYVNFQGQAAGAAAEAISAQITEWTPAGAEQF